VNWTTFQYDGLDRPTLSTNSDSTTVATAYDISTDPKALTVTSITDELGRKQYSHHDARGALIRSDAQLGASFLTVRTDRDPLERLTSITDPINATWAYSYDSLSRKKTASDPDMGAWSFVAPQLEWVLPLGAVQHRRHPP